jgi:hypothetical protein
MAASKPVLCGHGENIDFPAGQDRCVMKFSHDPPGGFRAAGAGPRASCKVQSQDIEQRVALGRVQAAIRGSISIVGTQSLSLNDSGTAACQTCRIARCIGSVVDPGPVRPPSKAAEMTRT